MQNSDIRGVLPGDAEVIREVQRLTWLATYPNETYGITEEDIEACFYEDLATAQEKRERRRRSLCTPPLHSWVALVETSIVGFCIVKQDEPEHLARFSGQRYWQTSFANCT
jgi:hypothetical protein